MDDHLYPIWERIKSFRKKIISRDERSDDPRILTLWLVDQLITRLFHMLGKQLVILILSIGYVIGYGGIKSIVDRLAIGDYALL